MAVGIIDYGMGNLLSVYHAVDAVGGSPRICKGPAEVLAADVERLILPGVGGFPDCMSSLHERGFVDVLTQAVQEQRRPIFGICLGMQAMARSSVEGGRTEGLGWLDADVVRLEPSDDSFCVPHVGWNDVQHREQSPLFDGLTQTTDFYFVHSYHLQCTDSLLEATCDHGGTVTAAVRTRNIFATQFHPEKSQDHGLKMLANFLRWIP